MCANDFGTALEAIAVSIGMMVPTIIAFITALAALIGACVAAARELRLWLRRSSPVRLPEKPTNKSLIDVCASIARALFSRNRPPPGRN